MHEEAENNVEEISEYEKLSKEIQVLKRTIDDLQSDITIIKERVKKMDPKIIVEEITDVITHKNESKQENVPQANMKPNKPSSDFKKLQNMLTSSRRVEMVNDKKKA